MPAALATIEDTRLLPVLSIKEARNAWPLAQALKAAGLPCAEVTFRTAAAEDAIRAIARDPDIALGAGTVLTRDQVQVAVNAGARYIVTPGFNARVVLACQERRVPVIPGVSTATEILMALEAGIKLVKLFPAEAIGGLKMLEALSAPFPMVRFIPTGGIDAHNLTLYLSHPAVFAVGGSWMAPTQLIGDERYEEIRRRTTKALDQVAQSRSA
jgi:2-dehydro-3-deoxyphosphogluconate aldolase/(4S)-4-hydroxy-2-oxoglutarate aldolase